MDSIDNTEQPVRHQAVKLITCILNSEKDEKKLLQALYEERHINRANSVNCRGFASLFEAKTAAGELPIPHFARLVEVVVSGAEADEIFDFIYEKAGLGKPGAGVMFMASLLGASSFSLPQDIPQED
jgi:nitrogen regulatory protein PII